MNIKNCLCCHGKSTVIGKKNGYFLAKCQQCGFITTHPLPTEQDIKSFYSKKYFVKQENSNNQFGYQNVFSQSYRESNINISRIRLGIIATILHRKGAILDLGCAAGTFLDVAKEQGWDTSGVEINPEMRDIAAKVCVNKISASIEDVAGVYEVITMWEYLEHVRKPAEILQKAGKLLTSGGLLCISFPNIENRSSIQNQIGWEHVKPPEHLHYWNAHNIELLLEKSGFQIVGFRYFGLKMQLEGVRQLGTRKNPKTIFWPLMSIFFRLTKHLYSTKIRKKFPSWVRKIYEGMEVYAILKIGCFVLKKAFPDRII